MLRSHPGKPPRISAAALSRLLKVSPAAVSYALNGKPGLAPDTRRRILEAATELGLATDGASAGQTKATTAIGVVLADVGNPFYSDLATAVADVGRKLGFEVFFSTTNDVPASVETSVKSMIDHGVEAMIVTAAQIGDATVCRLLRQAKTPFVQLSRRCPGVAAHFVGIDDEAAGHALMRHVIGHGYRDIAIAAGPQASAASRERSHGYMRALREAGLASPANRRLTTDLGEAGGHRAAQHLLSLGRLPEAVVCGTDAMALGLIDVFFSAGVKVPEQVAVVGFDGLVSARSSMLRLTTVIQPRRLMAEKAVDILAAALAGRASEPVTVLCPHTLHLGATCGCRPSKGNDQ
jgi:LacI family transcriptional regulator